MDHITKERINTLYSNTNPTNYNFVDDYDYFLEEMHDSLIANSAEDFEKDYRKLYAELMKEREVTNPDKDNCCKYLNPQLSYIKVPMTKAKKGDGVRVKRLLLHDPGIESGDEMVYGTEYIYEDEYGKSSGVACNEPTEGFEGNAIVTLLPRHKQSWFNMVHSGRDRRASEGPVGETIMPIAKVVHSRVVTRNIHTGQTGSGYTINSFYTWKDFPPDKKFKADFANSEIDDDDPAFAYSNLTGKLGSDPHKRFTWWVVPAGVVNYQTNKLWMSQAFRFLMHDMNGKPRSVRTYSGEYSGHTVPVGESSLMVSSVEYTYFDPGEPVDMVSFDTGTGEYIIENKVPGKEVDLTMEMHTNEDRKWDFSLEVDIEVILSAPSIIPTFAPTFNYEETEINTHANSRIIRYPVILKSVETFKEGVRNKTDFLAFNNETGNPVVSRTYDVHHFDFEYYTNKYPELDDAEIQTKLDAGELFENSGAYYSWDIPASWMYPGMGQKAGSSDNTNQLSASVGQLVTFGEFGNPVTPGEMEVTIDHSVVDKISVYQNDNGSYGNEPLIIYNYNNVARFYENSAPAEGYDLNHPWEPHDQFGNTIGIYRADGTQILFYDADGNVRWYDPEATDFPYQLYDADGNAIYHEEEVGGSFTIPVNTVLSANAITMKKDWFGTIDPAVAQAYGLEENPSPTHYVYEQLNAKYLPHETYVFNSGRTSAINTNRNYNGGLCTNFVPFDWTLTNPRNNEDNGWMHTNEITKYSPNSQALEEENILGIPSAVKYGYHNYLPVAIAGNAKYSDIQFYDFEIPQNGITQITEYSNIAHSGSSSLFYNYNKDKVYLNISGQQWQQSGLKDKGAIIKVWLKSHYPTNNGTQTPLYNDNPNFRLRVNNDVNYEFPFTKIAQVGEWALYSIKVTDLDSYSSGISLKFIYNIDDESNTNGEKVFFDDIRIQPVESTMKCMVYDKTTFKVLTEFDDQHFGLFYQYDAQGSLIRKMVETEKGLKTVSETHMNVKTKDRPSIVQ